MLDNGGPWRTDRTKDCRLNSTINISYYIYQESRNNANTSILHPLAISGRILIGNSGQNCRRMRLHRPFMVRGYREPARFGYSTTTCVNSAVEVLDALKKLHESSAPYMAVCKSHDENFSIY